jgi:hypothetical protein
MTQLEASSGKSNIQSQVVVAKRVLPKTEQKQLTSNKHCLQKSPLNETTTTEQGDGNPQNTMRATKHQKF